MNRELKKQRLLDNPSSILKKKPFYRGVSYDRNRGGYNKTAKVGELVTEPLPTIKRNIVSQAQFEMELDPNSHKVLFDDNIPCITQKINGKYVEIEYKRMAIPWQKMIKNKHVLHLCGNKMQFTHLDKEPTETQRKDFITYKTHWDSRNMDGMRTKMVDTQLSCGDAALLFYHDYMGNIKARLLSYNDGYVIYTHNDDNGDRLLDCVWYQDGNVQYLDCYDEKYMYRFVRDFEAMTSNDKDGWVMEEPEEHGFSESPMVTKRGDVAWNDVQNTIEVYEVMYNIFIVIQKRHGWGILYVRGKFSDDGKKIAGAIVLNDTSPDGTGSADYKTPPSPDGMIETMKLMKESIQEGSGTTFILPKDINMSGDISGIALQVAQSLDNETALQGAIEWQNVADKMCRLFKEGLAKELVAKGENPTAVTDFKKLNIGAKFKPWRPMNETEYNNMLIALSNGGLLSQKTGVEKNTESTPDEIVRIAKEQLELEQKELKRAELEIQKSTTITSNNGSEKQSTETKQEVIEK